MWLAYRLGQWLAERLSRRHVQRLAEALAGVQCARAAAARRSVRANLEWVMGRAVEEGDPEVREVFRHFGRYLVEFFTAHRPPAPHIEVEGWSHLAQAQGAGTRGVIVYTTHFGNWELGAAVLAQRGVPVEALVLGHPDPRVNAIFTAQRKRLGVRAIPLGPHATAKALAALRRGGTLAIAGDWEYGGHGVRVQLCGRPTTFAAGPAILSLRSGAAVVPSFLIRTGPGRFRLVLEPPVHPGPGRGAVRTVRDLTQAYAAAFEPHLRRDPTQWVMFRPMAPAAPSARLATTLRPSPSHAAHLA